MIQIDEKFDNLSSSIWSIPPKPVCRNTYFLNKVEEDEVDDNQSTLKEEIKSLESELASINLEEI